MSFGSGAFLVFLLIVVVVYYALPPRLRWVALLLASYAFYLSAGPRFLPLLLVVTLVTYAGGLFVRATGRKSILALALLLGVMPLLVFKYSAFVAGSVDALVGRLGMPVDVPGFSLLLPIGISFYTFKALSYLIDVYRDLLDYLKGRGVDVVFFLPPYHPTTFAFFRRERAMRIGEAVEEYLRSVAAGRGIAVVGSYDPSRAGVGREDFLDALHLRETGVEKVFAGYQLAQ